MRTAQELFKVIIEAGFYKPESEQQERHPVKYPAMCLSAHSAYEANLITLDEKLRVFTASQRYINRILDGVENFTSPSYLGYVLELLELPCMPEDRKALYLDWDNRPEVKK